jgi:ribosomal protein L11 methyltransferase
MFYTRLQVVCDAAYTEILMAEIADAGFDTFMETEKGFEAYAEMENFEREKVKEIKERYERDAHLIFFFDRIQKQNWNEEWEKNYEPIIVEQKCVIRASFHKIEKKYPYEIIITPKMSFGTGHHQTTYLMIKNQMAIDHQNKRVMDAGCGTAILSVMACKLGALGVEAFDIDEWSMVNGKENAEVNGCSQINLQQGTINEVKLKGKFDIILANINKNVLLSEIETYQTFLSDGGKLLISGFYTHDIDVLKTECARYGLQEILRADKETWASVLFQKS